MASTGNCPWRMKRTNCPFRRSKILRATLTKVVRSFGWRPLEGLSVVLLSVNAVALSSGSPVHFSIDVNLVID